VIDFDCTPINHRLTILTD